VIVLGDSKRLGQVLVNLLSNSVKFTDYGHIRLDVKLATNIASAQMIEFSVEDTGIGIQSDKLSQIFDPFTQADNSAQRQYQGTGLGLTIARQLVEAMGGEIRVESLVNRGTKFSFQIPLKPIAGSPFVDCNAAYEKRVAIINNADSESAALAQTFEALRCAVTLFNSSSFSSTDINLGDFKQFDFIVVSGNAIAGNLTQKIIEFASKHNRRESLLATLSPFELTHREFLHKFGINRVLVSPFLLQDVPAALIGAYKEDFSAYDDFIELEKYSATGLRILAADDIAANQVVIKCLLEDAGHEVDVVSNGKELLEAVGHLIGMRDRRDDDRDYDLVLTDVQMPIMDGLTATRNIRQIEELRGFDLGDRLPVIAVTAHAMAEQQQEILSCGVDGFITKPIDPEELEAAMQRVLVSHGKFGQS
jgi:CheY-like chemotaxis protein